MLDEKIIIGLLLALVMYQGGYIDCLKQFVDKIQRSYFGQKSGKRGHKKK